MTYPILVLSCSPFALCLSSLHMPPSTQLSIPPLSLHPLLHHTPTHPPLITIPSYTIHLLKPSIPSHPLTLSCTPYPCTSKFTSTLVLDVNHTQTTSLHPLVTLPYQCPHSITPHPSRLTRPSCFLPCPPAIPPTLTSKPPTPSHHTPLISPSPASCLYTLQPSPPHVHPHLPSIPCPFLTSLCPISPSFPPLAV